MRPCERAHIPGLEPPGALRAAEGRIYRAAERGERKGHVGGVLSAEGGGRVGGGGARGNGAEEGVVAVAEGRERPGYVGAVLGAALVKLDPEQLIK